MSPTIPVVCLILPFQNEVVSPHTPNLVFVNTSNSMNKGPCGTFPIKVRPNCSVYTTGNEIMDLDLSHTDFFIEMKGALDADPFVSNPTPITSNDKPPYTFLHNTIL
jgi:hypothetical protein